MTAANTLDSGTKEIQVQGDASVAAVPAFACRARRANHHGLGHSRICQGIGKRPVIMGGPVGVGALDIERFSAEGAVSRLVYLGMGAGVAAGALPILVKVMLLVLHHANRSIGIRLSLRIDIDQRVIILIGEGTARGQQVRQDTTVAVQRPVPSAIFGVFESAAADLDGSVSGPIFP